MKRILLILTVIVLVSTSCKKDTPTATDITVNFTHTVDGSDLIANSMIYTNAAGEDYSVQTLKYLISDITLYPEDGSWGSGLVLKDIHFIDISDESTFSFTYNDVPNNNYTALQYTMGLVNDSTNETDYYVQEPFHATMAWPNIDGNNNFNGGYHFMKLEGAYNNDTTKYNTHTGGRQITGNPNGPPYSFHNQHGISLSVNDDLGHVDIHINMEINNWYQTPNQIAFSTYFQGGIMANHTIQEDLEENGKTDVFSIRDSSWPINK